MINMKEVFEQYLPINASTYCEEVSSKHEFELALSFNRKSKFGHYKYWPQTKSHTISINKGLSQPLFLVTFLHELAHLEVMTIFGRNAKPHGNEWKNSFRNLMFPILNPHFFDPKLLSILAKHLKNPKASLAADPKLWDILFPINSTDKLYLRDIKNGDDFIFKNRLFKKVKSRRTRALCYESKSGNNYLVPLLATIKKVES